jgi:hypothetical protein
MPFKWNATYNFNYPLLDKPIDVNGIKLYPAQPDNTTHPTCIHYYEFETNDIGGDGKTEAMRKAQERLKELIELAALAKYRTEVSFHSLVLVDVEVNQGFLPGGVNFNFAGPPYFPPGQNPVVIRQKFETSAAYYQRIRELDIDIQKIIRRSLRW